MAKQAFSYIRMSTEAQLQGDSKRRQLEKSKEYAEAHGYQFVDSLEDIGVSAFKGKNIKDGELGRFRQAIYDGEINPENTVLLVESLDRLSRENVLDAFEELNKFLKTGITIITTVDGQRFTKQSLGKDLSLLYTAIGVMIRSNEESERKSERLKEAWETKRDKITTQKQTSVAPRWLRLKDDKSEFELIEHPANTVRKIFELCIDEGMGTYSIARFLNENISEYPKFTKPEKRNRLRNGKDRTGWHKSYVSKILHNPSVYGYYQTGRMENGTRIPAGEPVENYFPPVISKKRFLLAQAKLRERQIKGSGRRGDTFANLFINIAQCGNCGTTMGYRNKGKPPKGNQYLRCNNAESKHTCTCPAWNYQEFEKSFFEFVSEVDLAGVFKKGADKNKLKKLRNERDSLLEEIEILSLENSTLSTRLADPKLPKQVIHDIYENLENRYKAIEEKEDRKQEIRIALSEIESRNVEKTKSSLLRKLEKMNSTLKGDELKALRLKTHNQIREVVEQIIIHNTPTISHRIEIDELPEKFIRDLKSDGLGTDDEIEKHLNTDYGRKLFTDYERYYTVVFKNGTAKQVRPYFQRSVYSVSQKAATFYQNRSKRKSELRSLGKALLEETQKLKNTNGSAEIRSFLKGLSQRQRMALKLVRNEARNKMN